MIEERIRLTMRHLQNSLHCARMFQKEEIKELLIARFSIFLWKPACSSCRWRSISDFPGDLGSQYRMLYQILIVVEFLAVAEVSFFTSYLCAPYIIVLSAQKMMT